MDFIPTKHVFVILTLVILVERQRTRFSFQKSLFPINFGQRWLPISLRAYNVPPGLIRNARMSGKIPMLRKNVSNKNCITSRSCYTLCTIYRTTLRSSNESSFVIYRMNRLRVKSATNLRVSHLPLSRQKRLNLVHTKASRQSTVKILLQVVL